MGRRTMTRRAAWLATTLVAGSLGAAFAASPAAAADVTVTIGPAPDYVISEPNLTVTIGDVVTYQNLGNGSGQSSDIHILAHLPAHWVDIVVYSTTSAPTPIRPEPSKFVWETGPWAIGGKGYPPYGANVSFPPITEPTTLILSCLVHGSYDANRVYTSRINQTINLIPAPVETPTPDATDPTDPTPSPSPSGEVLPIATDLTTLPPTDALATEDRASTNVAAIVAALVVLLVPAIAAVVLRPARPRRRLE